MTPEHLEAWRRFLRDTAIMVVGLFMLVYGTLRIHDPTVLAVVYGAGLTALGLPPMIRVDQWIKRRNGEE